MSAMNLEQIKYRHRVWEWVWEQESNGEWHDVSRMAKGPNRDNFVAVLKLFVDLRLGLPGGFWVTFNDDFTKFRKDGIPGWTGSEDTVD